MQVKGLLEDQVAQAAQQGGAEAHVAALQQAQDVAVRLQEKHATWSMGARNFFAFPPDHQKSVEKSKILPKN